MREIDLTTAMPLEWHVLYHKFNKNDITTFNVFNHGGFSMSVCDTLLNSKGRLDFGEKLRADVQYYFWSKCEYEIIISPWPPDDKVRKKIDVYDQLVMNWDIFIDYIWSKRDTIYLKEGKLYYYV